MQPVAEVQPCEQWAEASWWMDAKVHHVHVQLSAFSCSSSRVEPSPALPGLAVRVASHPIWRSGLAFLAMAEIFLLVYLLKALMEEITAPVVQRVRKDQEAPKHHLKDPATLWSESQLSRETGSRPGAPWWKDTFFSLGKRWDKKTKSVINRNTRNPVCEPLLFLAQDSVCKVVFFLRV